MNTKKHEMKNRAFDSEKGGGCSFFSLFYYQYHNKKVKKRTPTHNI